MQRIKFKMVFSIRHRTPAPNGLNFQTFFYPTFFLLQLNPTNMKRILHLVPLRNIIFKSSYNWLKNWHSSAAPAADCQLFSHVHGHLNYYLYIIKPKLSETLCVSLGLLKNLEFEENSIEFQRISFADVQNPSILSSTFCGTISKQPWLHKRIL